MALHGVLHSEVQAPYNLRITFQKEIQDATNQVAELLRSLGKDIGSMKLRLPVTLLERVHSSTVNLQLAIDKHLYLLGSNSNPPLDRNNANKTFRMLSPTITSALSELTKLVELDEHNLESKVPIVNSGLQSNYGIEDGAAKK